MSSGSPMQVVHCASYGGPYAGSFIPMLSAAASEAASRGHITTLMFSEAARGRPWLTELDEQLPVRFVTLGSSRREGLSPGRRAIESVVRAAAGPVVIHTHFSAFDIPAALVAGPRRNAFAFWHVHTRLADDRRTRVRNSVRYRLLGPMVSRILCVSPEISMALRSRGAPAAKLVDFPNAVDVQRFVPPAAEERAAARARLGLDAAARVVLHFGWDWEVKGGELLLAIAARLAHRSDLIFLTVLGEDRGTHARVGGHPNVRVLAPCPDARQLYAASDVFLSCSRDEGMPLAVLEALACGLPVVATDLPVHRRLLQGLPGAALIAREPSRPSATVERAVAVELPAATVERAAATVERIASLSPDEQAAHRQAARRAAEGYGLAGWARQLVDLYEAVVQP